MRVVPHEQEKIPRRVFIRKYENIESIKRYFHIEGTIYCLTDSAFEGKHGYWIYRGGADPVFRIVNTPYDAKKGLEILFNSICECTDDYLHGHASLEDLQEMLDLTGSLIKLLHHYRYLSSSLDIYSFLVDVREHLQKAGFNVEEVHVL